jgi:hypothetical protein
LKEDDYDDDDDDDELQDKASGVMVLIKLIRWEEKINPLSETQDKTVDLCIQMCCIKHKKLCCKGSVTVACGTI